MLNDLRTQLNTVNNIPPSQLNQCSLKLMGSNLKQEISQTQPIISGQLFVYNVNSHSFELMQVNLVPNIIIIDHQYLVLSRCTIQKLQIKHQNTVFKGIRLNNQKGNVFIFYQENAQVSQWKNIIKGYCKLSNFVQKFKIVEQIMPNFYIVTKKKDKTLYTMHLAPKTNLKKVETIYSELQTLRGLRHQGLLELLWVYEDTSNIYIVYQYFRGELLDKLLDDGLYLDELQFASTVLQILKLIKFFRKNCIYHGNISAQSVIVNTQNSFLSLHLHNMVNVAYDPQQQNDQVLTYIAAIDWDYIAPEVLSKVALPSTATDLYQLGVLMYFITFFTPNRKKQKMDLNILRIDEAEKYLMDKQLNPQLPKLQDAVWNLLEVADKRIKLEDALKHQWFINVQTKVKPKVQRKQKKPLPSIRTIIELYEQSELELKYLRVQEQVDEDSDILDEDIQICEFMNSLEQSTVSKRPSKENHEKHKAYTQQWTQLIIPIPDDTKQSKQLQNSKTVS